MDKLNLLKTRKSAVLDAGKSIREKISALIDENSFVEFDRYTFSKNEFYGENSFGEGVITGYATLCDTPIYVVAQNPDVLNGGLSLAGAKKIVRCLDKALVSGSPVVYLFSSLGVQAGDGIGAMEGVGEVVKKMQNLKDEIPQFAIINGDVFGSSAIFASTCDYVYMFKDSCVAYASPLVLSAKSGKMLDKQAVGGYAAASKNLSNVFEVEDILATRNSIANVLDVLPAFGGAVLETNDDDNRSSQILNTNANAENLISAVFDKDYFIELGKGRCPEVKTAIGRIGGFSVASVIFDAEDGVYLNSENICKIKDFIYYANDNGLPLIFFTNTNGIETNLETANSFVMKNVSDLVYALDISSDLVRINVVYGKAIGLGYTLFASRSMGVDYSYAFANAKISVFEKQVGAQIEYGASGETLSKIESAYEENQQDAFNAAQNGYIDNVIEPEFVRQYVISALSMLIER